MKPPMTCPLCSTPAASDAAECPSCGAIFAKLRERKERERKAAEAALAAAEAPTPALDPRLTPWRLRVAAATFVALWMLGFGLYYRARVAKIPRHPRAPRIRLADVEVHRTPASPRLERPAPEENRAPPPGLPSPDSDFDD